MLQPFKRNFLQHALAVNAWMQQHEAKGGIDPRSLSMEIAHNGRAVRFYPQFVAEQPGGIGFVPHLQPGVSGFVGWLPYFGKGWEASRDKLAFKRFAQAHGLITPTWSQNLANVKGAFLIKHRHSTLGRSQRGPFVAAKALRVDGVLSAQGASGSESIKGRGTVWSYTTAKARLRRMSLSEDLEDRSRNIPRDTRISIALTHLK